MGLFSSENALFACSLPGPKSINVDPEIPGISVKRRGKDYRFAMPMTAATGRQAPASHLQHLVTLISTGEQAMSKGKRVLLVDDNLDAAESLAQLLSLSGHDARTAGDGSQALRVAQEFHPDVVFCDLGLPGMNGFEVAKELRLLPFGRDMVLAALTGYGQPSDREKSAEAGFDAHLVKPVDPSVIESFLDDYA